MEAQDWESSQEESELEVRFPENVVARQEVHTNVLDEPVALVVQRGPHGRLFGFDEAGASFYEVPAELVRSHDLRPGAHVLAKVTSANFVDAIVR